MKRLMILAGFALAACQPMPATDDGAMAQTPSAEACAARGGTLQPVGRMQTMQCVIAYADAGKVCTSGDQCAGDCRIDDAPFPAAGATASGRCQADSRPFGCHASVENGKATAAICID
jgi:putative hemolysin